MTEGSARDEAEARRTRVQIVPAGLRLANTGEVVPLYAGSVHYWRLDPKDWRPCLEAVKKLGFRLVDTYVPWGVHELSKGEFEFGGSDPRRDVARFLELVRELGLYAIVRPGPHINAELTYFGLPERIVWDPRCQAKSPRGGAVMLPIVPVAFPVPSYASEAFHEEVEVFFRAAGEVLSPLRYPDGPIVLLQVDNEGALYFRDGAYDQDYHPDAVALYREFLKEKYGSFEVLAEAYGGSAERATEGSGPAPSSGEAGFSSVLPPRRFDAERPEDLAWHLDWSAFHEVLLARALERFGKALAASGLGELPTMHNLPMGQEATPLNAARMSPAVDLVGLDYYHTAGPGSRTVIARRTTELAARSEALSVPAFACEIGAGYPPFFPPLDERDSAFTVLASLAYGLRGFNAYMAVERDRWVGAPIDPRGRMRPFSVFWQKLVRALEATGFATLRRSTPVRLVTPRLERRLARVMHAFGPVTGAVFSVLGQGARERCIEDDLGLGRPFAIEADHFLRGMEEALDARGIPFAHVGGEDRDVAFLGASWVVVGSSGALSPELLARLEEAGSAGARITFGPNPPTRDGLFRLLPEPYDLGRLGAGAALASGDPSAADAAVARAQMELDLPTYACDPHGVFATVHEDASGKPRVLFVLHPGDADVLARVALRGVSRAVDLFEDQAFTAQGGTLEVRMPPRTVKMLALP